MKSRCKRWKWIGALAFWFDQTYDSDVVRLAQNDKTHWPSSHMIRKPLKQMPNERRRKVSNDESSKSVEWSLLMTKCHKCVSVAKSCQSVVPFNDNQQQVIGSNLTARTWTRTSDAFKRIRTLEMTRWKLTVFKRIAFGSHAKNRSRVDLTNVAVIGRIASQVNTRTSAGVIRKRRWSKNKMAARKGRERRGKDSKKGKSENERVSQILKDWRRMMMRRNSNKRIIMVTTQINEPKHDKLVERNRASEGLKWSRVKWRMSTGGDRDVWSAKDRTKRGKAHFEVKWASETKRMQTRRILHA